MDEDDPVLVALVRQPHDMELVRSEGWYRIPTKRAPQFLTQAHYLAFYLTRAFGEERWSVREYAPLRGHELARRRDLFPAEVDHPRADEAYFKLQLGPLIKLPRPILSRKGRRILFIWTSGAKFSSAVELDDLLGKSAADDLLWEGIKGAGISADRHVTVRDRQSRYRVDYWIPCARGDVALFLGDGSRKLPKSRKWQALQVSEQDVIDHRTDCVDQIKSLVRKLGHQKQAMEPSS